MDGKRNIRHKTNSFNRRHHSIGDLQVNTYRCGVCYSDSAPDRKDRAANYGRPVFSGV